MLTDWRCKLEAVEVGTGRCLRKGSGTTAVLTIGPIGNVAAEAIVESGLDVAHYDMRFLKPLDEKILEEVAQRFSRIITVEDGTIEGGLGSAVLEWMADHGYKPDVVRLGLPDNFVEHGTPQQLYEKLGIDKDGIIKVIRS